MVNAAHDIISNNEGVKEAFTTLTGIEEGSAQWDQLWQEGNGGPTIHSERTYSGNSRETYPSLLRDCIPASVRLYRVF